MIKKMTIKLDKEKLRFKPRLVLKAPKRHKDKKNDYKRKTKYKRRSFE